MTYVAKISLPGYDVMTATPEQCSIHSEYPPLKSKADQTPPHFATLLVDFTATAPQNVTHTLLTIPHPYGYVPLSLSNIIFNTGTQLIVGLGYAGVGSTLEIKAFSDNNNFYVTFYDDANWSNSSSTLEVSYYIFAENGS